jgi:hypothetical protein
MSIGTPPLKSNLPAGKEVAVWTQPWSAWFSRAWEILFAVSESGTTAQRPTKNLWPGRMYFDTSLGANGKPIWVNKTSTGWVLADGTAA